MKYIYTLIISIILIQVFSICNYAQQYEDAVYLKNGIIIYGVITEHVIGDYIKIQTADDKVFVFKMDEIEKMTRKKIAVKVEDSNKVKIDSVKDRNIKTDLKTKSTKKKEKLPVANNSITIQPIGLLTLLTNFEYDRSISSSFSTGLKISFMTFFLRSAITFEGSKSDVDNAEAMKESLSSWGIGTHIRYYPGNRAIEGFFMGLAFEKLSASFDKIEGETVKVKKEYTADLSRLEFEIGHRSKLSGGQGGFTIQWSLGAGVGFGSSSEKKESFTIPIGSFGFGIGYSF